MDTAVSSFARPMSCFFFQNKKELVRLFGILLTILIRKVLLSPTARLEKRPEIEIAVFSGKLGYPLSLEAKEPDGDSRHGCLLQIRETRRAKRCMVTRNDSVPTRVGYLSRNPVKTVDSENVG